MLCVFSLGVILFHPITDVPANEPSPYPVRRCYHHGVQGCLAPDVCLSMEFGYVET